MANGAEGLEAHEFGRAKDHVVGGRAAKTTRSHHVVQHGEVLEVNCLFSTAVEDGRLELELALCRHIRVLRLLIELLGVTKLVNPPIYACIDNQMEATQHMPLGGVQKGEVAIVWGRRPENYTTGGVTLHISKGSEQRP